MVLCGLPLWPLTVFSGAVENHSLTAVFVIEAINSLCVVSKCVISTNCNVCPCYNLKCKVRPTYFENLRLGRSDIVVL